MLINLSKSINLLSRMRHLEIISTKGKMILDSVMIKINRVTKWRAFSIKLKWMILEIWGLTLGVWMLQNNQWWTFLEQPSPLLQQHLKDSQLQDSLTHLWTRGAHSLRRATLGTINSPMSLIWWGIKTLIM